MAISPRKLENKLRDFYNFHDPFKTDAEVRAITKFGLAKGLDDLNEKLRIKYGEDLIDNSVSVEREDSGKFTTLSSLKTPTVNAELVLKARKEADLYQKLHDLLEQIRKSKSPEEIRMNLVLFYKVAEPERFDNIQEMQNSISQQMEWSFRYGKNGLISNLADIYTPDFSPFKDSPELKLNSSPKAEEKKKKKKSSEYPETPRALKIHPDDKKKLAIKEIPKLCNDLNNFYAHFNPARLDAGIDDILEVIQKRGLDYLNGKLLETYGDDLNSFVRDENVKLKAELYDKLFKFFVMHDKSRLGEGLQKLVIWAAEKGEPALNKQLVEKYGCDLSNYDKIDKETAKRIVSTALTVTTLHRPVEETELILKEFLEESDNDDSDDEEEEIIKNPIQL